MTTVDFQLSRRSPYADGRAFGDTGAYEQVDGLLRFTVDPDHPANQGIVDLGLAPRDRAGHVSFVADFSVVMPTDSARGNGRALVELPNRGRRLMVPTLNLAPPNTVPGPQAHPGDGFLFCEGYTVASIGWQWDVLRDEVLMGLEAPLAHAAGRPLGGQTTVEIRPSDRSRAYLLANRIHRPLPTVDVHDRRAVLYVRDYEDGEDTVVARSDWRFAAEVDGTLVESTEHVYMETGFEPGKIYQLVYYTDRAPVAGTGLLALREVAPLLRNPPSELGGLGEFTAVYAWGVSQTGRMLRHYLSLGLNRTEAGEIAYDGMLPHVAGARRGAFNHRFAQPSNQTSPVWGHVFPFADLPSRDALTSETAGLLDRQAELGGVPKLIYTNSSAEYWRGDAALAHISTDAKTDLPESDQVRSYLFASTQHTAGYIGEPRLHVGINTTARYTLNVTDYRPLLRAALVNLDSWVTQGIEPPPSRHPRLSDGTAVERRVVLDFFAMLPGFEVPDASRLPFLRTVDLGADEALGVGSYPVVEGAFYPALVSALDADGNERAGIRLPDIAVPVGTHAGWNPRDPVSGAPEQIMPMTGSSMYFAPTRAERMQAGDPRPSLEERYASRAEYESRARAAAEGLVRDGYLLHTDLDTVVVAALERYDAARQAGLEERTIAAAD